MKIEIEQKRYDELLATEKLVKDFFIAMDELAYGGDHDDDPEWLGNEDFDSEHIAELVMKHFKLNY